MIKRLIFIGFCVVLTSCKDNKNTSEEVNHYEVSNQLISLTPGSVLKQKIKTQKVNPQDYSFDLMTAGIVQSIPTNYAEIASPFAGRILKSFVRLGQKVTVNEPIFEISSPDYFDAQKDYFDAKQEHKQAEINLKRQRDLFKNGVGVQQEVEEAETEFSTAKAAYQNAAAALKIFNVDLDNLLLGQPLIVRSPIAGEVIENNIVIGQYLKDDADPVAKIAALEKVWIVGKVKEKDIKHLSKIDRVQIELAAFPETPIDGNVYHINEIVDEETRSIEVFVEALNIDRKLKPGMYVNVRFIDKPELVVLIPKSAVLQDEENAFVYTKAGDDQYRKRTVVTRGNKGDKAIVTEGLASQDEVVSEGGIYLLQAL